MNQPPPAEAGARQMNARKALTASICLFALALPISIAGANIGWGLILASLLAYRLLGGTVPLTARSSAIEKPLWFFLAASVTASAFGVAPAHSFRFLHQDAHKLWLYTLLIIGLATHASGDDRWDLKPLVFFAAGFAIAAAVGIYQSCQVDPQLPVWDRPRAHAFVHPVTFGCQMTIAVIGASCFLVRPPRIWRGPRGRAAAMGLLAVCGTALFFSNTRGALFACFLALAATALLLPRPRKMLMLALAVGLALFFAGELARPDRSLIAEFAGWKTPLLIHGTQKMRLLLWDVALRIGIDHPLTGVGHNNFRTVFENYHNGLLEGYAKNWGTAHNLYLHHFAERGLLGLTALLVFLGAFWLRALRRVRQAAEPWNLWAFGTATAFLFMNMTEVALQVEILWMLVFFVWIWAEVLHRRRPHAAPAP